MNDARRVAHEATLPGVDARQAWPTDEARQAAALEDTRAAAPPENADALRTERRPRG